MAQTTAAISAKDMAVFLSTDGSTWTNEISGIATSVEISGGERATAGTHTFEGDTPILTIGKRGLLTVTVRCIYTEGASEPYNLAQAAYEAGSDLYVRWSPKGDDSTEYRYTTSAGKVKNPVYPGGSADSADPILIEIVVECSSITEATV